MRRFPTEVDEATRLLTQPLHDAIERGADTRVFPWAEPDRDTALIYALTGGEMTDALAERPNRSVDDAVVETTRFALRGSAYRRICRRPQRRQPNRIAANHGLPVDIKRGADPSDPCHYVTIGRSVLAHFSAGRVDDAAGDVAVVVRRQKRRPPRRRTRGRGRGVRPHDDGRAARAERQAVSVPRSRAPHR